MNTQSAMAILLLLLAPRVADAQTFIVSNIEPSGAQINYRFSSFLAVSFTTDSGQYTVDRLGLKGGVQTSSADMFISVHSEAGGLPGGQIGGFTFNIVENDPVNGVDFFEPAGSVQVEGNTTYWLVFGESANSGGQGWINAIDSQTQTGQWTIGNLSLASADQGGSWFEAPVGKVLQFGINATAVPESDGYFAMGLLCGFSIVVVRFIRKNRQPSMACV